MQLFLTILLIAVGFALLFFLLTFFCFLITFVSPNLRQNRSAESQIPPGKIYKPFRDVMIRGIYATRELPHEDVTIKSFDGLTLHGKYYEFAPGAPIELMFHGYRGSAERDLCVGVQRCFSLGRSALVVDQRGSGLSEGHVITFGIREHRDCLSWVDFMVNRFGADVKIILTGISMGAATVMMASAAELPPNVIGALADCGYTSAQEIIKKVIRQFKLPADLLYPVVKLGAKWFGRFDLEETSPIEAMKQCRLPIIFVHGEEDAFVPCYMSQANYEACVQPKQLLTIPGAGHGLAYLVGPEAYLDSLAEFSVQYGLEKPIVTQAFQ